MKPWRVSSEAVKNMLPAYNNAFLFIFPSEIRDVRYLPFNRSWNWGDSSDTQHLAAGILSTSSKTYLLWHFTWGQIFRLASIKTAVLYNVCKAKIQNINPNLGLGREHEGWFLWRLHLQQCVCVCVQWPEPSSNARVTRNSVSEYTCIAGSGTALMSPQRATTAPRPATLPHNKLSEPLSSSAWLVYFSFTLCPSHTVIS